MTETEALVILTEYNRWRRDNDDANLFASKYRVFPKEVQEVFTQV